MVRSVESMSMPKYVIVVEGPSSLLVAMGTLMCANALLTVLSCLLAI